MTSTLSFIRGCCTSVITYSIFSFYMCTYVKDSHSSFLPRGAPACA